MLYDAKEVTRHHDSMEKYSTKKDATGCGACYRFLVYYHILF